MRAIYISSAVLALFLTPTLAVAESIPLAGCYERVYDADHLASHKRQVTTRSTLLVKSAKVAGTPGFEHIVAEAELHMWVRGSKKRFDSSGFCSKTKGGLSCGGSLSAAEADTCKDKTTGMRDCRVNPADAGGFNIEERNNGVMITIKERLELVPDPYDVPPFLNLSGKDSDNRSFVLKLAPSHSCN